MENKLQPQPLQSADLQQAYENYIEVLNDEINDLIGMASIHGWQSRNVERGKQAREAIEKAKAAIAERFQLPEEAIPSMLPHPPQEDLKRK